MQGPDVGLAITVGLAQAFSVFVAGLTGSAVPRLTKIVGKVCTQRNSAWFYVA